MRYVEGAAGRTFFIYQKSKVGADGDLVDVNVGCGHRDW